MKTLTFIVLVSGFTIGILNNADAQRGRNRNESSGRQNRESNGGQRRESSQRNERFFSTGRENNYRFQQRNAIERNDARDSRSSVVERGWRGNSYSGVSSTYSRDRLSSRYSPRYNNYYAYNDNRYNYRSYREGAYYTFNNRRYAFMYGPRYSIIPRSSVSIYFGGYPYYYNDGFFYGYYGGYYQPLFPPVGIRIRLLPYGYTTLFIGGYPYYYYNGIYYRQYDNDDYEVVDPPMGAAVYNLPEGAKSVILNGEKLYELNGTYYKEDRDSKGQTIYTVVGKNGEVNNTDDELNNTDKNLSVPPLSLQMGDIVTELPEGSKAITINGEKLYVTPDNTYLKEDSNADGEIQYKVVGR